MSDPTTQPGSSDVAGGIGKTITQLFNPAVVTALRYALTALGPLFAVAGVAAFTPDQVTHIIAVVQQVGVAAGAIVAFIGIVGPIFASAYGTFKATQRQQVKSVQAMPGVTAVTINTQATPNLASMAVGKDDPKVVPVAGSEEKVAEVASAVAPQ